MDIFQPFMFNRNKCKCGLNKDDECHTKQNVCIICGESYTAVTGFQILHHQVFGLQLCSGYKFLDFLHAAPARYQSDWHTEPSDTPVQGFRNPTLSPLYEHTLKNSIMQVYMGVLPEQDRCLLRQAQVSGKADTPRLSLVALKVNERPR